MESTIALSSLDSLLNVNDVLEEIFMRLPVESNPYFVYQHFISLKEPGFETQVLQFDLGLLAKIKCSICSYQFNKTTSFPFEVGQFPVKYLGLPLTTKRMTLANCTPLVETIRQKISSWTARHLSYAGRMQLLDSVIRSITSFWFSAFRLPSACLKEIDKLCGAFLWFVPALNTRKSKVDWQDVCRPKSEGGLGFQPLKVANQVSCLKLIWRIISNQPSLWVRWVRTIPIGKESFWSIKDTTTKGSWIWKKVLKYRELARTFHKIELGNGKLTSFWFDNWSPLGRLYDITGHRGTIDLGIPIYATMAEVFEHHHRRNHRVESLKTIEDVIDKARSERQEREDISSWKYSDDLYKRKFVTKSTSNLLRNAQPMKLWYEGVWFKYATPKYTFLAWIAVLNRLSTGDRMRSWGSVQVIDCCFCRIHEDSRDHLFFKCRFSEKIWRKTMWNLLGTTYTSDWSQIVNLLTSNKPKFTKYLLGYAFQTSVYGVREIKEGMGTRAPRLHP